ncbi:MAG: stalk domain-containing protein [Candidatus Cryosericum sp.]|nr:Ig-like domain-containing protein [bacterium]
MTHFLRKGATVLVVSCLLFGLMGRSVRAAVSVPSITANPPTVATGAAYTFQIYTTQGLAGSTTPYVLVEFPAGFGVPASISSAYVTASVASGGTAVVGSVTTQTGSLGGRAIKVTFSTVNFVGYMTVTFALQAGIVNPGTPGAYAIAVSTSAESGGQGTVVIGAAVGTGGTTSVQVTLDPAASGKAGEYAIQFTTPDNGALVGGLGDYIDIVFPEGTRIPSSFTTGSIFVKQQYVSTQTSGNRLRLFLGEEFMIAANSQCNVIITTQAGILNPEQPGMYTLQVATSKNFSGMSNAYQVTGTAVSGVTVAVDPAQQGMQAQVDVSCILSYSGALKANSDRIYVQFPTEMGLPTTVSATSVRVNGTQAAAVGWVAAGKAAITVPSEISGGSSIHVVFQSGSGISNPATVGTYSVAVSTSQDTSSVSGSFLITASQVTASTVALSNPGAALASSYTITFSTGAGGSLTAGIDRISIEFPVGTTIPSSIAGNTVTVNGLTSSLVTVSGSIISTVVPANVPSGSPVTVVFLESAGLRNPVGTGTYVVRVSTTKESSPVSSAGYAISALPTVSAAISPASPDGKLNYYVTRPSIAFLASSPIDASPIVYYRFDNNQYAVYGGTPVLGIEGQHTLDFYAVDRQGHQSVVGSLVLLVDTVAPVLNIASPQDNVVLTGRTFEVSGSTDVGGSVSVNGTNVVVDETGAFSTQMTLTGDSGVVVVRSADAAGNISEKTLHVSFDTTSPVLTLTTPRMFDKVYKLPLEVTGRTEPGSTLTVNGTTALVNPDGTFETSIGSLPDGASIVTVTATDAAGNATTRTASVSFLKTTIIRMQIGKLDALVNAESKRLTAAPIIKNGSTLVPLRFIAETLGIAPSWDAVFSIVDMNVGGHQVRLQVGVKFAGVDGRRVSLDTSPVIISGVTMVPLRFVSETMGADVLWDATTSTVTVIYPKQS